MFFAGISLNTTVFTWLAFRTVARWWFWVSVVLVESAVLYFEVGEVLGAFISHADVSPVDLVDNPCHMCSFFKPDRI